MIKVTNGFTSRSDDQISLMARELIGSKIQSKKEELSSSPMELPAVKWVFLPLRETNLSELSSQKSKQMKMTNSLSFLLKITIELKYEKWK